MQLVLRILVVFYHFGMYNEPICFYEIGFREFLWFNIPEYQLHIFNTNLMVGYSNLAIIPLKDNFLK